MKYYKDTENNIFAYEANQEPKEGLVEILEPIVDGKILPQHKNLDMQSPEVIALLEAEKLQAEKDAKVLEAKSYLTSTDWYYSRLTETGKEVPEDVVAKRIEARALINELEG